MAVYIALLRAVNVMGTGKLPMSTLIGLCEDSGFEQVRTYIASGNAVFRTRLGERRIKAALEERLAAYAGRSIGVMVRSAGEMAAVLAANPFHRDAPEKTVAIFLDHPPPADTIEASRGRRSESLALGEREIYVAYRDGIAGSRLVIPAARTGTFRNMNTIARLTTIAGGI